MLPQVLQLLSIDDVERWRWSERKAGEVSGGAACARQPPRSASDAAFPQKEVVEEGEAGGKLMISSPPPEMKEGRCNEQVMQMKRAPSAEARRPLAPAAAAAESCRRREEFEHGIGTFHSEKGRWWRQRRSCGAGVVVEEGAQESAGRQEL